MKKFLILMTMLVALFAAIPFASAEAQSSDCPTTGTSVTKTYTEAEINSSFRVTNPISRNVSNVYVDLQPGQVTISENYTWRSSTGVRTDAIAAVLTPAIVNGRIEWSVVSVMANGQPVSAELLAQINASLMTSWRRWFSENGPAGRVTDVTITDADISYTYTPWVAGCVPPVGTDEPVPPVSGVPTTVTYSEAQINSSFHVTNPVNRNISNEYVNLQPGQVTITATLSYRQGRTTQTADVAVVLTPAVVNGRVDWTVISASANGQPASSDLLAQINASLAASWHRWISDNAPAGVVSAITITEDTISYTYTPR